MVVDYVRSEDPHALPTNMHGAFRAGHVIAASVLLDPDLALWTLLDVFATVGPTLQQPLLCFRISMYLPLFAAEPIVILLTSDANGHKARPAPKDPLSREGFERVNFGTVGGGAISEHIRMVTNVFEEGNFQEAFKLGGMEEPLYYGKGDRNTALPLAAHTRQGKLFGVGGGKKEMAEAPVAIDVAAGETVRLIDRVVTNRTLGFPILELVLGSNGVGQ